MEFVVLLGAMKASLLLSSIALASVACADTVIRPVSLTLSGAASLFDPNNIINGSGLSAALNTGDLLPASSGHLFGDPFSHSWVTNDPGGFPANYFNFAGPAVFVLDLGADYAINNAHLWAYSGGTGVNGTFQGNSAKDIAFRFNTAAQGGLVFSGSPVNLSLAPGPLNEFVGDMPRQDFGVGSQTARFVEMTITSNWFIAPGDGSVGGSRGGDRVGLGEVRFSVVPEPATGALALLGIAAIAGRRRRVA